MNIKFVIPALLALCGAAYVSPVHAVDYTCLVYSGADGGKLEKSDQPGGVYKIKADDQAKAEAKALSAATGYKKGKVTLTKAQCTAVAGASSTAPSEPVSSTTAPAPAAAPAPAPAPPAAGGGKTMYCMIYDADNQFVYPPKDHTAEDMIWAVPVTSIQTADDEAVKFAQAQGKSADSAMCEGSVATFKSESY